MNSKSNKRRPAKQAWWASPIVLIGALIAVAAIIAAIVVSSGGDDTAGSGDTTEVSSGDGEPQPFGGPGVPEVNDVVVVGDPLTVYASGYDDAVGRFAPEITATSLANGVEVTLGPGKARVIGFFAHWCPHCQAELPVLRTWLQETQIAQGIEFVAVSTSVQPDRQNYTPGEWFTREKWETPVIVDDADGSLLAAFGFTSFPAFVTIDEEGRVLARRTGNIGEDGFAFMFAPLN